MKKLIQMKIIKTGLLLTIMAATLGLSAGENIPQDLSANNQDGKKVLLSSFIGKPLLVYFYPKDDTPGCTTEACEFRNDYGKFQKKGVTILGVSAQDAESHKKFRKKHHLPFDLLTDSNGSLAKALGAETTPANGLHRRQSVLIGPDGKVVKFYSDVDPKKHSQQVLEEISRL